MVWHHYQGLKIERVRKTSFSSVLLFLVLDIVFVTVINLIVFRSGVLNFISNGTNGLINGTLVVNLILILVLVFFLIIRLGKLDFRDLGVKKGRLLTGVIATLIIWVLLQVINLAVNLIINGKPIWNEGWKVYRAPVLIGAIIAQVLGNCLFEELTFRGFLIPQFFKIIRTKKWRMTLTIILTQVIFALMHIPNRILYWSGFNQFIVALIIPFALGILFALTYVVTDNLFFAIGIHALCNIPMLIFQGLSSTLAIVGLTLLSLAVWPFIFRTQQGMQKP